MVTSTRLHVWTHETLVTEPKTLGPKPYTPCSSWQGHGLVEDVPPLDPGYWHSYPLLS